MSDTPSIILVNGSIHTVDTDNSIAEAIAIQGDRISLVGSNTCLLYTSPSPRDRD